MMRGDDRREGQKGRGRGNKMDLYCYGQEHLLPFVARDRREILIMAMFDR